MSPVLSSDRCLLDLSGTGYEYSVVLRNENDVTYCKVWASLLAEGEEQWTT
jgi:hypothetical protein